MTELLIDGEWVAAAGAAACELFDPTRGSLLEPVQCAAHAQRERAIAASRGVLESWARRPPEDRSALVAAIVDEIRQVAGALAERQAIESGQPVRECQDLVANALRRLRRPAAQNREAAQAQILRLPRQRLWPFWEQALRAVEAGSAIVCELPADRALSALAIAHCAQRLPPGVLNVITVETDAEYSVCADVATEFVFVGQDADVDLAVAGAVSLRLYNTGQRAGQSTRIHVEAPLAYPFADRLHEYLAFLEAGDPRKPVTDLGPLRSQSALQRAIEQIGNVLRQGALLKLGGRAYQPWGLTGYFLQPTLLVEGTGVERGRYESIAGPAVIVSPTIDIGASLRESSGVTHPPLRLTAFTGQVQQLERSLRAAGFVSSMGLYTRLVERAWKSECVTAAATGTIELELIDGPQMDWFPYKSRRGLKL